MIKILEEALYIILGAGAVISGFMVISSKNPVHSVFSLVLVFANVSILLLAAHAQEIEYLALLFIIIYVGAIAILFLFVIMMLNIKLADVVGGTARYVPIGVILGVLLLMEIALAWQTPAPAAGVKDFGVDPTGTSKGFGSFSGSVANQGPLDPVLNGAEYVKDTKSVLSIFSEILYTTYYEIFLMSSLILFVAMIGAIVLTSSPEHSNKQDLF